jgi:hypothetical protein
MKIMSMLVLCCPVLLGIVAASAGCMLPQIESGTEGKPAPGVDDPLVDSWVMTRVSMEPALPAIIPAMLVDQLLPTSATWKITGTGDKLNISYDGRSTWFNPLGINIASISSSATVSADKKSCTFSEGGSTAIANLTGLMSLLSATSGEIKDISGKFVDEVGITMTSQNEINAVITCTVSGSYMTPIGKQSINYQSKVIYTGKRK